jgi:hypothetical protein
MKFKSTFIDFFQNESSYKIYYVASDANLVKVYGFCLQNLWEWWAFKEVQEQKSMQCYVSSAIWCTNITT